MHRLYIAIYLALYNLVLYKLRVGLTALSLIIGVASVIAMLAIAEGARLEARRQIAGFGASNSGAVPRELLKQAEATERSFNLVLGSIAGISLLVGGVGVMSIMLATVSERTREIGIRRAIGARRRDIMEQFLIETTVVSSCGGAIGVLVGLAVPPVFSYFSGMPVVIRPWPPVVAFLIAVTIGVAFGVYPAVRAAMLDPVKALRSE
jgi:ABC-type antimicrobial peptide transport system permease subunit